MFNDIERKAVLELHAGGAQNGSDGPCSSPLLADNFADITWIDAQPQYGGAGFDDDLNGYVFRMVDQSLRKASYKILDSV